MISTGARPALMELGLAHAGQPECGEAGPRKQRRTTDYPQKQTALVKSTWCKPNKSNQKQYIQIAWFPNFQTPSLNRTSNLPDRVTPFFTSGHLLRVTEDKDSWSKLTRSFPVDRRRLRYRPKDRPLLGPIEMRQGPAAQRREDS